MLQLTILPKKDLWDEKNERFMSFKGQTLVLEHSLVSISKWESRWHKAFLAEPRKSHDELVDYIRCMTLTQNVDPLTYDCLSQSDIEKVKQYIDDPMTATVIKETPTARKGPQQIITSELIYYWMVALQIPSKYEKWHLNRLMTLIKICNIENQPKKKMSKDELYARNARLNAARRKK